MKKKVLSILLILSMVLTMAPVSAFADTMPTAITGEDITDLNGGNDEEKVIDDNNGDDKEFVDENKDDEEEIVDENKDDEEEIVDENKDDEEEIIEGEEKPQILKSLKVPRAVHSHCICGSSHEGIGDHVYEETVEFKPWTSNTSLPSASDVEADGLYWYLTGDVTLTDTWKVPADNLVLCLNGNNIIGSGYVSETDNSPHINAHLAIIAVTGNNKDESGSIIKNAPGYTFTLTDCRGSGRIVAETGTTVGGGVDIAGRGDYYGDFVGTTFNMYNANICGITGSGVSVGKEANFNMYGGEISENSVIRGTQTNGAFGLGVNIAKAATVNIAGGTISNNTATGTDGNSGFGGGIYNYGKLTITEGTHITGNASSHYGGGIYNAIDEDDYTAECTIIDSYIEDNTAMYGGGIYNEGDTYADPEAGAKLTIKKTVISGNTAEPTRYSWKDGAGGGIYIGRDYGVNPVTIEGCTIENNISNADTGKGYVVDGTGGAGIYTVGTVNIKNSKIINNESKGTYTGGGGILSYNTGDVSLDGCTISGNKCTGTGSFGGGIYYYNFSTLDYNNKLYLKDTKVQNNTAVSECGGVYIDRPNIAQHLTLDGEIIITGNTYGDDGIKSNLVLINGWTTGTGKTLYATAALGTGFSRYSEIGVSTGDEIADGTAKDITDNYYATDYTNCFTSDDNSYEITTATNAAGSYKVQLKKPLPKYTVTVDLGGYGKVDSETETVTDRYVESVEQGTRINIKIDPASGYYFTEDYVNSINDSIKRDYPDSDIKAIGWNSIGFSFSFIQIAGTPTENITITLPEAPKARKVADLVPETYQYNGKEQTAALKSGKQDGDVIKGSSYTNAGTYKMTVTSSQTPFDNGSYTAEVEWKIEKNRHPSDMVHGRLGAFKPVFKAEDNFKKDSEYTETYYNTPYTGSPKEVGIEFADGYTGGGDITVWYREVKGYGSYGEYTQNAPTKVGIYRVAITMTGGDNFEAKTKQWDVIQFEIKGIEQPAPEITTEAPTEKGGNGKLIGTTTAMEYTNTWSGMWEGCSEGYTEVPFDTGTKYTEGSYSYWVNYYVRYKADPDNNLSAGEWAKVYVPDYKEPFTATVTISGEVKYGKTLFAHVEDSNSDSGNYTYVWKRDGAVIPNATEDWYDLTQDDIGKKITVSVTCDDRNGAIVAQTEAVTAPKLEGITFEGGTYTYDNEYHLVKITNKSGLDVNYTYSSDGVKYYQDSQPGFLDVAKEGEKNELWCRAEYPGYEPFVQKVEIVITPKPVTITVTPQSETKKVGQEDPAFTATVEGLIGNDGSPLENSVICGRIAADENKKDVNDVITITAYVSYWGNKGYVKKLATEADSNYDVTIKTATLTIVPREKQELKFDQDKIEIKVGQTVPANTLKGVKTSKAVKYESSNTKIATVDSDGKVTVVKGKDGTVKITATAPADDNYKEATAEYTIVISKNDIEGVTAKGYTGVYDNNFYGITVTVTTPKDAEITYGTSEGNYYSDRSLMYVNAGTYTVYYKVSKEGYNDVTGSEVVEIFQRPVEVVVDSKQKYVGDPDPVFTGSISNLAYQRDAGLFKFGRKTGDEGKNNAGDDITITLLNKDEIKNYNIKLTEGKLTIKAKDSQLLIFTDNEKTLVIGDKYTNTLSGAQTSVTYESSNTDVATVNAKTGEVTAVGEGRATITATAASTTDIKGATESYDVVVSKPSIDNVKAESYEGSYDGKEHTIKLTGVIAGATVMYGTEPGTYNLTEAPKFKNVEYDSNKEAVTHTVYYKVSKDGYNDNTGSATVKINPVEVTIKINNVSKKVGSGDPEFTAKVTGVIKGETLDYTLRRAEADKDKEHVGDVITIEADYTPNPNYNVTVTKGILDILEKDPQDITFAKDSVTANLGETVTNKLSGVKTTVTYTSSNADVATVDENGKVTILKPGKTTITATAVETAEFTGDTASYELTVKVKVTIAGGGTGAAGAGSYDENETVTIKAGTRSGYSFTGWTAEPEVTITDASANETTITVPAENVTLTANWKKNTGTSGGGGGGGTVKPDVKNNIKSGDTVTGADLDEIVKDKKDITITDNNGTKLVLSPDAVKDIDSNATGDIVITIKETTKEDGKTTYRVIITGGGETISGVKGGIKLSLPYKLKDGETEKDVKVWKAAKDGTKTEVPCSYNKATGFATFTAESLDDFIVGTEFKAVVDEWVNPFADVENGKWYTEAIEWAAKNGITSGLTDTVFGINGNCTRAQIVTFLWRAAGSPEPKTTENPFTDVTPDLYYAKAVLWAVENGITSGVSDAIFAPNANCTRAQAVTFLYRAFGSPEAEGNSFTDVNSDVYYAKAVAWAVKNGITSGIGDGLFGSDNFCTRSQIVTFLFNAYSGK